MLKPFLAACEIKSPKLVSIALASIQKLLANDLVTAEGMLAVTRALEQVCSLICPRCAGSPWLYEPWKVMAIAARQHELAAARALNVRAVHVACCMPCQPWMRSLDEYITGLLGE